MFSNKRKRLLVLYDEGINRFVDRRKMMAEIQRGLDPHHEYVRFYQRMEDPDLVEEEFVDRFWNRATALTEYTSMPDQTLSTFVDMLAEKLACKTQENNV
jgi:hypothetical protein